MQSEQYVTFSFHSRDVIMIIIDMSFSARFPLPSLFNPSVRGPAFSTENKKADALFFKRVVLKLGARDSIQPRRCGHGDDPNTNFITDFGIRKLQGDPLYYESNRLNSIALNTLSSSLECGAFWG